MRRSLRMREDFGRRRLAGTTLIVAILLALALPGVALAGQTRQDGVSVGGPFVALGDSYAAGNLIPASPTGTPAGCLRSTHNYSGDIQATVGASSYIDAACSGATTVDMTQPQPTAIGTNPPQFDALAANDSFVTVTIGGNDI